LEFERVWLIGLAESVPVVGDNVLCAPGGPEASRVALDKKTG
jgi:hypothetical protein